MVELPALAALDLYVGFSRPVSDPELALEQAVLHASEQAARSRGISAASYVQHLQYGRSAASDERVEGAWNYRLADSLVSEAVVREVVSTRDGTIALVQVPDGESVDGVPYSPSVVLGDPDAPPLWTVETPRIPGYLVGVGVAQRSRSLRDSIDNADQEALIDVMRARETMIASSIETADGAGFQQSEYSQELVTGHLRGFKVIARYVSADGTYFYSLGVAHELE